MPAPACAACPRVLMLCHDTIQPFSGGGATLRGLFSAFPPDALFSIYHDGHPPEPGRLGATHRITNADARYLQPVGLAHAVTRWFTTTATAGGTEVAANVEAAAPAAGIGARLKSLLGQTGYFKIDPAVLIAIRAFQPQVLYGWIGDPSSCRSLMRLAKELQLPYVVHFMDNHIGLDPGAGWAERLAAYLFRRQVDRAVAGAAGVLAISDAMADAYGQRWQRRVPAFHNVMATDAWPAPGPRQANAVFELAFTGSIEPGQLSGLLDVARAVERLRHDGEGVQLVLYLTDYYRRRVAPHFAPFPGVVIRPHPPAEGLRAALVASDALILAYGFDQRTIDYYRYSFPTKLVPYMLSGTPVLAYGPAAIAPIGDAARGGWARMITQPSDEALAAGLLDLIRDPDERRRLGRLAHLAACREHDQAVVSPRFAEALRAAAQGRG